MVCELCTPRAAHEGWIREGLDDVGVRRRGGAALALAARRRLRERLAEATPSRRRAPRRPTSRSAAEPSPSRRPTRRAAPAPAAAPAPCAEPPRAAHGPRGADERRAEGRPRGRASSTAPSTRARSPAWPARSARRSSRVRPSATEGSGRHDRRRLGAELVPLRGRSRRRGRRACASSTQGAELAELDAGRPDRQRRRRRARAASAGAGRLVVRRLEVAPMIYCVVPEELRRELYASSRTTTRTTRT